MLYKQAWKDLKDYIENGLPLLEGQEPIRQILLSNMKEIEKRWKRIPHICGGVMFNEDDD